MRSQTRKYEILSPSTVDTSSDGGEGPLAVDVQTALSIGWDRLKRWWGILAFVPLLTYVGTIIMAQVALPLLLGIDAPEPVSGALCAGIELIFTSFFSGGLLRIYVSAARGQPPTLGLAFECIRSFRPLFVISIVASLVMIGPPLLSVLMVFFVLPPTFTNLDVLIMAMTLLIPGSLVTISLSLAPYACVDQGVGVVAALRKSWTLTKGCLGQVLLLRIILHVGSWLAFTPILFFAWLLSWSPSLSSPYVAPVLLFAGLSMAPLFLGLGSMMSIALAWVYLRRIGERPPGGASIEPEADPPPLLHTVVAALHDAGLGGDSCCDDGLSRGIPEAGIDDLELNSMRNRLMSKMFGLATAPLQFEQYTIISKCGEGGMGVVYLAYDPRLDRKVALKMIRGTGTAAARSRFQREAKAMARMAHPNVVRIYDSGSIDNTVFIAMEFVDGMTLSKWSSSTSRSRADILEVFKEAGRGLQAVHDAGLVHRDFKPDNVMVQGDGRVLVMDFGLAAGDMTPWMPGLVVDDGAVRTRSGAVMGTPMYMAPEQWQGRNVTEAADQFSFCIALWEALYRTRPFNGGSKGSLRAAVLSEELSAPPDHSTVPAWIHDVLVRGLRADPARRFGSISALLDALEADPSIHKRLRARIISAAFVGVTVLVIITALVSQLSDAQGQSRELEQKHEKTRR